MSTNINITVGDNALLDRAKQQQTANRQAQLNRENSTRLEAQATDERTKALAAAGKDANGNPLYGVPTPIPQIDRRPAANRQGGVEFGWFRLWTEKVQKRENSFTSGIPFPVFFSGYADRLYIQTAQGTTLIDYDYEEANLVYPAEYPYAGSLVANSYEQRNAHILPLTKNSCVLVVVYKLTTAYNFVFPNFLTWGAPGSEVITDYEEKSFSKAYLITPTTIKPFTVPSASDGFGYSVAEPVPITYNSFIGTNPLPLPLVRPQPPDNVYQAEWVKRRRQVKNALSQYGSIFIGFSYADPLSGPEGDIRSFYSGGPGAPTVAIIEGTSVSITPIVDEVSVAGPSVYTFFSNEITIESIIRQAYLDGDLGVFSQYKEEVIRTYPWLQQFVTGPLQAKTVYGFDRFWADLSQVVVSLYKIPTPTRGSYDDTVFDGDLNIQDLGYPPRLLIKEKWLQQPLSILNASFSDQARAGSLYFFTTFNKDSYCRQQLSALGFTSADLTP